jgi:predicted HD phosphohydrolase
VADLVALHVPAKGYIVAVPDGYPHLLSPASAASLADQGAGMSIEEQRDFEAHPRAADAVLLRKADDRAKQAGGGLPGLEHWWPVVEALVRL